MSGNQLDPKENAKRLLVYLRQLKNDRGRMADLRCALSPAKRARAWPLLAHVGGIGDSRIETVTGLFACHPEEAHAGNLGTTCRTSPQRRPASTAASSGCFPATATKFASGCVLWSSLPRPKESPSTTRSCSLIFCYWGDNVKARWAREYWGAPEAQGPVPLAASEATP